ncbi:MAG TPA: DUF2304 domain-containing protein [Nocardioidaceae bacterium]|jgi:hypothetical protein|nr:DUF2304 domain-containing protein [Nocardioidaceae bacterium]
MNPNVILGGTGSVVTLVVLFEMMRRHRLREKYAVFWALVAVLTLVVALFPSTLSWAAAVAGVQVPSNLLFFVASMVLLLISIQHSHELGRLEDRTRTLAEEVALLRMSVDERHARLAEREEHQVHG